MPTIKERFKQSLHETGTKLSNTVIGTPEERAERKQQNQQIKQAKKDAHFKGRLAGAKEQAYQEGKRSAKNHGWAGTAKAVAQGMGQGLNAANSIIGFPVEQSRQPRKKRNGQNVLRENSIGKKKITRHSCFKSTLGLLDKPFISQTP